MKLSSLALIACVMMGCGSSDASLGADGAVDASLDANADARTDAVVHAASTPLIDHVDPFLGTGGLGFSSGSVSPGPQRPFGRARPAPDTRADSGAATFQHYSGYWHPDNWITGFSHLRLSGAGVVDYGVISLMPTDGVSASKARRDGAEARKTEGSERAAPGYYRVSLDTGIDAEITATARGAMHRWTFSPSATPTVMVDLAHAITRGQPGGVDIDDASILVSPNDKEVSGSVHFSGAYSRRFGGMNAYFVVRFDAPFVSHQLFDDGILIADELGRSGDNIGALITFAQNDAHQVQARIGISFVSVDNARGNLEAELAPHTFDALVSDAQAEWESLLGKVSVSGTAPDDFTQFYTALYHSLLAPSCADDSNGQYRGFDAEVHDSPGFPMFTDYSLWDTFRTQHPLLALLYPDKQRALLKSLVQIGRDGGYIDRWPLGIGYTGGMVGESATLLFADAVAKGIDDVFLDEAYAFLRSTALAPTPSSAPYSGRVGINEYMALGYVPRDVVTGSASISLEYNYDDWALARIADALGHADDRAMFDARAATWTTLWDPSTSFLRARNADGSFEAEFDPNGGGDDFVEGNARQYQWYVPHDLNGLAQKMGGTSAMLARLDAFFESSSTAHRIPILPDVHYWHGNEPDIHAAWIFSAFNDPMRASKWVKWIARTRYGVGPDGLPGNDDGGTLSAWLAFSMLGLYPFPGEADYVLAAPAFTNITLHFASGDTTIVAPGWDAEASAFRGQFQGELLSESRISHAQLINGGQLVVTY